MSGLPTTSWKMARVAARLYGSDVMLRTCRSRMPCPSTYSSTRCRMTSARSLICSRRTSPLVCPSASGSGWKILRRSASASSD